MVCVRQKALVLPRCVWSFHSCPCGSSCALKNTTCDDLVCVCVGVGVGVCMFVCVCVHVCVCMGVCMCMCVCGCGFFCLFVCFFQEGRMLYVLDETEWLLVVGLQMALK